MIHDFRTFLQQNHQVIIHHPFLPTREEALGEVVRRGGDGGVERGGDRGAVKLLLLLLHGGGRGRSADSRQLFNLLEFVDEGGEVALGRKAEAVNRVGPRVGPLTELLGRLRERHRRRNRTVDNRFGPFNRGKKEGRLFNFLFFPLNPCYLAVYNPPPPPPSFSI